MNSGRKWMTDQTRKLLWPIAGMLALGIVLQVTSLLVVMESDASTSQRRQYVAVMADQRTVAEQFESATYLALVGLATSDWELLLRQRTAAQELAQRFEASNTAMLQGGQAHTGDVTVMLRAFEDPERREALTSVRALWVEAYAAHVRVLRSDNHSLKDNPDVERFRAASSRLHRALGDASTILQRHARAEAGRLAAIHRFIPLGLFLLMILSAVFVIGRILLPFAASTEELARSEAALRQARDELEHRVAERTQELAQANEALRHAHDGLEVRVKERTQELRDAQRRAVELARQAGMAELATNVLHNVGNVLNSINTSSTILDERLRKLRVQPLLKLSQLLEEKRASLAAFVTEDERGRCLPEYLGKLGEHLSCTRDEMLEMTTALHRHVEHIRMIVELQQTYALSTNLVEAASLEELVEDALRINAAALGRHGVTVERHFTPLPNVMVDKHKLLQIVLNLISNAKYAVNDNPAGERRLILRIERPTDDRVHVQVRDNGMGIAPELLTKIFQHGFTTRKDGHGFGLHSCAIAARALGGSLVVHSDGPQKGATFTVELPYRPEQQGGPPAENPARAESQEA
jgi:C4-dicarboxylate-specific signal transduction histidine kinase